MPPKPPAPNAPAKASFDVYVTDEVQQERPGEKSNKRSITIKDLGSIVGGGVSCNGRIAVLGFVSSAVAIVDLYTQRLLQIISFPAKTGMSYCVKLSGDMRYFIVSGDHTVFLMRTSDKLRQCVTNEDFDNFFKGIPVEGIKDGSRNFEIITQKDIDERVLLHSGNTLSCDVLSAPLSICTFVTKTPTLPFFRIVDVPGQPLKANKFLRYTITGVESDKACVVALIDEPFLDQQRQKQRDVFVYNNNNNNSSATTMSSSSSSSSPSSSSASSLSNLNPNDPQSLLVVTCSDLSAVKVARIHFKAGDGIQEVKVPPELQSAHKKQNKGCHTDIDLLFHFRVVGFSSPIQCRYASQGGRGIVALPGSARSKFCWREIASDSEPDGEINENDEKALLAAYPGSSGEKAKRNLYTRNDSDSDEYEEEEEEAEEEREKEGKEEKVREEEGEEEGEGNVSEKNSNNEKEKEEQEEEEKKKKKKEEENKVKKFNPHCYGVVVFDYEKKKVFQNDLTYSATDVAFDATGSFLMCSTTSGGNYIGEVVGGKTLDKLKDAASLESWFCAFCPGVGENKSCYAVGSSQSITFAECPFLKGKWEARKFIFLLEKSKSSTWNEEGFSGVWAIRVLVSLYLPWFSGDFSKKKKKKIEKSPFYKKPATKKPAPPPSSSLPPPPPTSATNTASQKAMSVQQQALSALKTTPIDPSTGCCLHCGAFIDSEVADTCVASNLPHAKK